MVRGSGGHKGDSLERLCRARDVTWGGGEGGERVKSRSEMCCASDKSCIKSIYVLIYLTICGGRERRGRRERREER
jgi:hypothetical protein